LAEIKRVRVITHYEGDIDAFVYHYKDGVQEFHLFAQFANVVRGEIAEGVVIRPAAYDVLVSHLGNTGFGGTVAQPVVDIGLARRNITEYFKSRPFDIAKQPPDHIIFG
jgi:hypothetical protein